MRDAYQVACRPVGAPTLLAGATGRRREIAIREREAANTRIDRSGKSSPLMSEKLAFEKACRHSGTVDFDEIPVSARAKLMNRSCDELLTRPGFAGDQNGGIRGRHCLDLCKDRSQAAPASHDAVQERRLGAFPFVDH